MGQHLLGFPSFEAALAATALIRHKISGVDAIEVFFAEGLDLVCAQTGLPPPFVNRCDTYLLVEVSGSGDQLSELASVVDQAQSVVASALASDRPGRDRLWAYRERHTEAINAEGIPHKLDVTLPFGRLAEFRSRVAETLSTHTGTRSILFGHVGDGNLHVNVLGPDADDSRANADILQLAAEMGGSISSEHGIGVAKVDYLELTRTAKDIGWMRGLKQAMDPRYLLNPGVIFPVE